MAWSLFAYLATVLKSENHVPILVGGYEDHVHLLFGLARTVSVSKMMEHTKVSSSKWVKQELDSFQGFEWQRGYGAFAVSYSSVSQVMAYISNQDQHHERVSFQDEFRKLMHENGIDFDERYIWD